MPAYALVSNAVLRCIQLGAAIIFNHNGNKDDICTVSFVPARYSVVDATVSLTDGWCFEGVT